MKITVMMQVNCDSLIVYVLIVCYTILVYKLLFLNTAGISVFN